jgi:hypothetical protein
MRPDVNLDSFCYVLQGNLNNIRKHIPRCDAAFNMIANSLGMLKQNIPDYFRDYKTTGDSSVIMQNFITDVAKTSKSSAKVGFQFQKIMNFYYNKTRDRPREPQIDSIFSTLQQKLNMFKKSPDAPVEEEDADAEAEDVKIEVEPDDAPEPIVDFTGTYDTKNNVLNYESELKPLPKLTTIPPHLILFSGKFDRDKNCIEWTEIIDGQEAKKTMAVDDDNLPIYLEHIVN